ncbi:aminotransferase class I/II-fold pyridoxal phosphate-dependent enzyme [Alkalicoccus daliensis]|uniref:Arginine/lysine/ornithine decarboxylase n=1 Tax=Alkalicoccus daliensis TaxID=745820 RepID=A0A1H0KT18_9BACI|nr:aminotransferase class I/II-fold pyridoxal phosphate-dependent enzyme [Alkalicoccus daliensis]SDO58921.1 Arginine/lysine/ornithine decarboxylase [Alkalicoccus daliensis]
MDQTKVPLYHALEKLQNASSYHVPGHKNGKVFPGKFIKQFEAILSLDKTEINGLDDLHAPESVIKEAQELLAALYQAKRSYFLVGGSTAGNAAMLLASVSRGDIVLVQRNSHQSVFNGLELAGAVPVFLDPDRDAATGLPLGIHTETLKAALEDFPEARAVFLTNPTYEGYGQSLSIHKALCTHFGALLLVDEAHGAHFLPENNQWFPESALAAGADLVVQSAHKTLPAMTMSAWLHAGNNHIAENKLRKALAMTQSSSPSYPLMASLDIARAYAAEKQDWQESAQLIKSERKKLSQYTAILPEKIGEYRLDPLKLSLLAGNHPEKPEMWQQKMETEGAYPELRSPVHLLLTLSLDLQVTREMFAQLQRIFKEEKPAALQHKVIRGSQKAVKTAASYEQLERMQEKEITWEKAEGKISADTFIPYPPGIPLLLRGEKITKEHITAYEHLKKRRVRIKGDKSFISVFTDMEG